MIDPQEQWAIQIDITNACTRACSNCTRFIGHHIEPFYMDLETFEKAANALKDFPTKSPRTDKVKHKVVGLLGGEPLIHPHFEEICKIFESIIPSRNNRGLWTSLNWQKTRHASTIQRVFGYINNNRHITEVLHSPILISLSSYVKDDEVRKNLIDNCWLQRLWSGTITPKGFFFCEVAGAFDILFNGPGGLPVEENCWKRPITDFKEQIERYCLCCGIPLQLRGRLDKEEVDDISEDNLIRLQDSPRICAGKYAICEALAEYDQRPWVYIR